MIRVIFAYRGKDVVKEYEATKKLASVTLGDMKPTRATVIGTPDGVSKVKLKKWLNAVKACLNANDRLMSIDDEILEYLLEKDKNGTGKKETTSTEPVSE